MSSCQEWWTVERVSAAREVLSDYPKICQASIDEIGIRLGRSVTYDALRNAFKRHSFGPPGSYCVSPLKDPSDMSAENDESTPQRTLRGVLWGDVHVQFQDKAAVELALSLTREINPDIVATMGDTMDCYAISDHDRDPNRVTLFDQEVDEANSFLDRLMEASTNASRRIYVEGNHEYRLPRYLKRRAPALFNLIQLPKLLRIADRGMEWVPYYEHTKVGYLHLTHECGAAGRTAHIKALDTFQGNVAIGHTHQLAVQYGGGVAHDTHVSVMCGWLGSMEGIDWMHKVNARHWQHGLVMFHLEPDGVVHVQAIPFVTKNKRKTAVLNSSVTTVAA